MLNNRIEEELRKVLVTKSDKGQVIEKGPIKLNELKDGQSVKRYVNGEIVEYTRYKNELFSTKSFNAKESFNVSRFDTTESLLSTPNYDSGWVDVVKNNSYSFEHFLRTKFLIIHSYVKQDDEIFYVSQDSYGNTSGDYESGLSFYMIDDNTLEIGTGNDAVWVHDNTSAGSNVSQNKIGTSAAANAQLRIFCWKINTGN